MEEFGKGQEKQIFQLALSTAQSNGKDRRPLCHNYRTQAVSQTQPCAHELPVTGHYTGHYHQYQFLSKWTNQRKCPMSQIQSLFEIWEILQWMRQKNPHDGHGTRFLPLYGATQFFVQIGLGWVCPLWSSCCFISHKELSFLGRKFQEWNTNCHWLAGLQRTTYKYVHLLKLRARKKWFPSLPISPHTLEEVLVSAIPLMSFSRKTRVQSQFQGKRVETGGAEGFRRTFNQGAT